jgi:hypothetical protein
MMSQRSIPAKGCKFYFNEITGMFKRKGTIPTVNHISIKLDTKAPFSLYSQFKEEAFIISYGNKKGNWVTIPAWNGEKILCVFDSLS